MSSQEVFWIAAGIGALFCAIFLVKGSQKEPTRLRLGGGAGGDAADKTPVVAEGRAAAPGRARRERVSDAAVESAAGEARIRSINVIFNYNGHSWDAYEVLGCPAGAPPAMVKQAFERTLQGTDPASHEFVRAAYQAITKI